MSPAVSIIVPCFNAQRFLQATLESVLRQTRTDWECIVVDDGSTDQSAAIAADYAARDSRIRVVRQKNRGRALAIMEGYRHAHSQSSYLFFLDSDDLLEKENLAVLTTYLDQHPEVAVVACQAQLIDAEGRPIPGEARSRWGPGAVFPRKLQNDEPNTPFVTFFCATGQGPFALHRRQSFEATNGFDSRFSEFSLHEDTDIFCQMALRGEVHYLPTKLYFTRRHGGNVSGHSPKVQAAYGRFREKWDHYPAADAKQRETLDAARRFYVGTFRPCRNLKVALQSFQSFIRTGNVRDLRWGTQLVSEAIRDFVVTRWQKQP